MSSLHADYYADAMRQVTAPIVRNEAIAESTYLIRIEAPQIAASTVPGQFVMIRLTGIQAPLIGRAFAIYDVIADSDGAPRWIDLVYLRKGALTVPLSESKVGVSVTLWGPLGNGFNNRSCDRLIMAAGGIGQTPMLVLGREAMGTAQYAGRANHWASNVELIYGARRASLLAGVDDFRGAGFEVTLCTDDGSTGLARRVPDVLSDRLKELSGSGQSIRVVTCGPEIMMEKVAEICAGAGVDCQVSMETPMACGIGICFSCVAKVKQADGQWDYKRTCVEGPIFDSEKIVW
jgi:dihydroorotate dehydrogenase electron transfer subunit